MRTVWLSGVLALIGALAWLEHSAGSPLKEALPQDYKLAPLSTLTFQFELKGQEETRVISSGNKDLYQGLYVFDGEGNCVAWDDYGGAEVREDSAVLFVPPTQGAYRVEIRSFFPSSNEVRVAVR